jgi:hypothetical protein
MDRHDGFCSRDFLADLIARAEADRAAVVLDDQAAAGLKQVLQDMDSARELDFREIGDHLYDGGYISPTGPG